MNIKKQIVQPADTSPALYDKGIQRVQNIVRVLLYVGREVEKILVALSAIGSQQEAETKE